MIKVIASLVLLTWAGSVQARDKLIQIREG